MESEILEKIKTQEIRLEAIYKSVEKTRKYILVVTIATIIAVVLPLIGLLFIIPAFLSMYSNIANGF